MLFIFINNADLFAEAFVPHVWLIISTYILVLSIIDNQ